tara:strand:+ start:611 stop:931 length:321 start_codon:yes stop_codon:yes gene_type:complete
MVKTSWGNKRTCTCGIRFYDLNKKEIECPGCGEMVNVELLSISNIENNLRKKTQPVVAEETVKPKKKKAKKQKDETPEADVEIDQEDDPKEDVDEIIKDKLEKKEG